MLTDICCNLTHESFANDQEEVLQRAREAGVTRFLLAGADLAESRACVSAAQRYPDCWAAVGVHPHQAREWDSDSVKILRDLQQDPKVIAIGECGLDYYRDLSPREDTGCRFLGTTRTGRRIGPARAHAQPRCGRGFSASLR